MGKGKNGSKSKPVKTEELNNGRPYNIMQGTIKDDLCNYTYQVTSGGPKDSHKVNGKGIVDPDMKTAFGRLAVHLACLDGYFLMKGIEVENIDSFRNHPDIMNYVVKDFKIKSSKTWETIVLVGEKYVSSPSGWIDITTHEVAMDNLGGYQWYNELIDDVNNLREEIALYKEGKFTLAETDVPEPSFDENQGNLFAGAEVGNAPGSIEDDALNAAKVH